MLLSNNILLIAAKLLNILLPNTITAAKYSGIPSLSPRYASKAAKAAFPKNPDIKTSA